MVKKKRGIDLSNKLIYTFVVLSILALIAAGVYAYGTNNPSNFGHSIGEINFAGGIVVPSGDVNITTGKLCLGGTCVNSWGPTVYNITNNYCVGKGTLSLSPVCITTICDVCSGNPGCNAYGSISCTGTCGAPYVYSGTTSLVNCNNTFAGYLTK